MNVPDELTATEYLNQLLQDKTTVSKMPKIFLHSERLLDEGELAVITLLILVKPFEKCP